MIRTIPNSTSLILRATHIFVIRIESAEMGEWLPCSDGLEDRSLKLALTLEEILKGTVNDIPGSQFWITVKQFKTTSFWLVPTPGVWSEQPLDVGTRLVAFCRSTEESVPEMLKEPFCEQLFSAENALLETQLALQAESENLTLPELLTRASQSAASLTYLFIEYLWAANEASALQTMENFAAVMQFFEHPDLSTPTRAALLNAIYSRLMTGTIERVYVNRFAIALFRLLDLSTAAALQDNIIQTFLPNLFGLQTPISRRTATSVFQDYPSDRQRAQQTLLNYRGEVSVTRLLEWLTSQ